MSDSRFHLKVDFEIYGQKFNWNPSLNYFDRGDGMDDRIFQWFVDCYNEAHDKYQDAIYEADRINREKATERVERAEFERLKAKYGDAQ